MTILLILAIALILLAISPALTSTTTATSLCDDESDCACFAESTLPVATCRYCNAPLTGPLAELDGFCSNTCEDLHCYYSGLEAERSAQYTVGAVTNCSTCGVFHTVRELDSFILGDHN